MPLWNIYHTPDILNTDVIRAGLARDITALYTSSGLPDFYVVVQFVPLPKANVFVAGQIRDADKGHKPFVRLVVEHMAVHKHEAPEGMAERFSKRIDDALRPYIADQGYDWEITVTDTTRDFWRMNGIAPPPFKSDAEKAWVEAGRPTEWDIKAKVCKIDTSTLQFFFFLGCPSHHSHIVHIIHLQQSQTKPNKPVTLQITDNEATAWTGVPIAQAEPLLQSIVPAHLRRKTRLIQTSLSDLDLHSRRISAAKNGLAYTAYQAHSNHHHLVIRPDDVWCAILAQLSYYINHNAEDLRSFFVAPGDREPLRLQLDEEQKPTGSVGVEKNTAQAMLARRLAGLVIDPEWHDWLKPSFSTTTPTDEVVGAVLFMGTVPKYHSHETEHYPEAEHSLHTELSRGLPSVALLGEVADWEAIRKRIDRMDRLGEEPTLFAKMLRPILDHMILSFQAPESPQVITFWSTMVDKGRSACSARSREYLNGWLTAFYFWQEDGFANMLEDDQIFDGISFPRPAVVDLPVGYASLPLQVDAHGEQYVATMVAGSIGAVASSSSSAATLTAVHSTQAPSEQAPEQPEGLGLDTVQHFSAWWIYQAK